tara:strand:- start:368 stop:811 length:444 start_codon:yes stop_codon:yes gene_type:complete
MDENKYNQGDPRKRIQLIVLSLLLSLSSGSVWGGQCTERKWREDYPRNQESGLICDNSASHTIFYIFSNDKDCAFELYYRNGRILAQSYVVTRYIEHLDFSGLRLNRTSLQLKDGNESHANCRVATAQTIINEYNENVQAQLSNNRF